MKRTKWDIHICTAIMVILMIFASQLPGITRIARVYPMIVSSATAVCVLLLLLKTIRKPVDDSKEPMARNAVTKILLYLLLILGYILIWDPLGFIMSTLMFTLVSTYLLGMKDKFTLIAFSSALTVVLYVVFTKLIMVTLPTGTLIDTLF